MLYKNKLLIYLFITIISILTFLLINYILDKYINPKLLNKNESYLNDQEKTTNNIAVDDIYKKDIDSNNISKWYIEFPTLGYKADIKQGTEDEILEEYVGHFLDTPIEEGNVCLTSHSSGSERGNHFMVLEIIEVGGIIEYVVNNKKYIYIISSKEEIDKTDISKLEQSQESKLTLITCIKTDPELRLCVEAKLIDSGDVI